MFKKTDFENIILDFLFTYRQFLLNACLHKRVNHEAYEKNLATWNTLLLTLEAGSALGLARILERDKDFGRPFNDPKLNVISQKIINIRNKYIAHSDLAKKRNSASFLTENQLSGSDIVLMFGALKDRGLQYEKELKMDIKFQILFTETQNNAVNDLDTWLKSFEPSL